MKTKTGNSVINIIIKGDYLEGSVVVSSNPTMLRQQRWDVRDGRATVACRRYNDDLPLNTITGFLSRKA